MSESKKQRGIPLDHVKAYWAARASKSGSATVGHSGQACEKQDSNYAKRKAFIFAVNRCPYLLPTLDYGCGIGRYAPDFSNGYLGVDVTESLLEIARKDHPDRKFLLLEEPTLPVIDAQGRHPWLQFDLFFTATVLQHNDDDGVRAILQSVKANKANKAKGFMFAFYENVDAEGPHIAGRGPMDYLDLVGEIFDVKSFVDWFHEVCGETHYLTMIGV